MKIKKIYSRVNSLNLKKYLILSLKLSSKRISHWIKKPIVIFIKNSSSTVTLIILNAKKSQ